MKELLSRLQLPTSFTAIGKQKMLLITPLILFLCIFYVYPLLKMLGMSFLSKDMTLSIINYSAFFSNQLNIFSLFITLKIGFFVTIICLLLGYPLSYYLSCLPQKKANILMIFILIPLWTSILVRTLSWILILGRNGIMNQVLIKVGLIDQPLKLIFNSFGLTLGMVHVMMPFMVLSLYSVMAGIDRNLLKAAQNLGAKPMEAFRKIFLPLSMPGITAGCILVFIISIGFFVTPVLLGGPKQLMLSMLIDQSVSVLLDWGFAAAASFILLFIVSCIFLVSAKIIGFDKLWGKSL